MYGHVALKASHVMQEVDSEDKNNGGTKGSASDPSLGDRRWLCPASWALVGWLLWWVVGGCKWWVGRGGASLSSEPNTCQDF